MPRLSLHLLGSFQALLNGQPIAGFGYAKVQALLAYLALEADRPHERSALAGLLWPDRTDRAAGGNLRKALYTLRRAIDDDHAIPPHLLITNRAIQFNRASDYWSDVDAFASAIESGRTHRHRSLFTCAPCIEGLQEAAELYGGDLMAGFSVSSSLYEEWLVVQREHLHRQALDLLAQLAAYHEGRGEYGEAIRYAHREVELEPWRESAHRQLMRALALSGQRGEALAQYEACRQILEEELGAEPDPETRELYQRIHDGEDLSGFQNLTDLHNLPAQITPFIGREALLAQIGDRLADPSCRLLALVGPGGSGKTRLALEAARREVGGYPDGVYWVALAGVESVEAIVPAVANAIGSSSYGGDDPRRQLLGYLRGKEMLLLLDSLEHLLQGVGLVSEILQRAPGIKVLATSRARLGVRGEQLYPVGGMDLPLGEERLEDVARYGAVQLFVAGARQLQPDFALDEGNVAGVVRICCLVDGLPLAILLAAAWVAVLPPDEIAAEIERGLDILETEWRDVPPRQRSMRAVFDHSWGLLPERERAVLGALSVFRGSFTREAAQEVAGASLRDLMALVNRSLLQSTETGRFEMHELLRQYGEGKLGATPGELERARDLHCAYYAEFLHRREDDVIKGHVQEVMREIDNIWAGWDWAAGHGKAKEILKSSISLWIVYMSMMRHREGAVTFAAAIAGLRREGIGESTKTREVALGLALGIQSFFSRYVGEEEQAPQLARESLSILRKHGARRELALCDIFAAASLPEGDLEQRQLYQESLAISQETGFYLGTTWALQFLGQDQEAVRMGREVGDRRWTAHALMRLGEHAYARREHDKSRQFLEESLVLLREVGAQRFIGRVTSDLGDVALAQGEHERAEGRYGEALAQFERIYDELGIIRAQVGLGNVALAVDDLKMAGWHYRQALEIAVEPHFDSFVSETELRLDLVAGMAALLAPRNEGRAVELAALSLYHPSSTEDTKGRAQRVLDRLRARLPTAAFAVAEKRGRMCDLEATLRELLSALDREDRTLADAHTDKLTAPGVQGNA